MMIVTILLLMCGLIVMCVTMNMCTQRSTFSLRKPRVTTRNEPRVIANVQNDAVRVLCVLARI